MRLLLLAIASVFLASCATPTPYQPIGTDMTGGYSSNRLAEDIFRVNFSANGFTPLYRAKDFAVLRAAEICKEHNFKYFSLLGEDDRSSNDIIRRSGESHTTGTVSPYGGTYSQTTTYTPTEISVYKPGFSLTIKCYTVPPGGHSGPVKDADAIIQELKTKYKIK